MAHRFHLCAPVAQGIERLPPEQKAAGSIPAGGTLGIPAKRDHADSFIVENEARWIGVVVLRHVSATRPSIEVAPSTDVREHQADAVATKITGVPTRAPGRELGEQRLTTTPTGQGRELDDGTRAMFEAAFGRDLSQVRVHTDASAATTARDIRAAAYTVGPHVYFASGQFAPQTPAGSHLLAHELAHVLQNAGRGTPTVHRAPLPAQVKNSPEHQHLWHTITVADWLRAAALLNAYSIDGIHSVFEDLGARQIESLYLGAIANDAVGGGSNIAKEALAASPELQKAVAAVTAAGISVKEFVDYMKKSHGEVMDRWGFWRFRTIVNAARSLPDEALTHLMMAEDTTVYLHRSGRVGTTADEQSKRVQEFKPHGVTGTAAALGASALTKDQDAIDNAGALGDNVGDLGGALAQTGAARGQSKAFSEAGGRERDSSGLVVGKGGKSLDGAPASKGNYVSPRVGGPLPTTAGVTQKPLPPVKFGTVPQNVREAALKAMAADPKRGSGVGAEPAAMESRKGEGPAFDLNQLTGKAGNFRSLDFVNPQGLYSVKTKAVGGNFTARTVKDYFNDLDTLFDIGPGVAFTKTQQAAASIAANRDTIQKSNAWPTALPKDATEEQIAQEIARSGKVLIPDDHLEAVRGAIDNEVVNNPHRWPGQDAAQLKQRFQPIGIKAADLDQLHKEAKLNLVKEGQ
ncbi:MAG: hypothetical protein QOJ61_400 [Mycobacterium sp.]|jgi:hypothetical protein|nr:hypothetical protein [Mycobacterium sp.]